LRQFFYISLVFLGFACTAGKKSKSSPVTQQSPKKTKTLTEREERNLTALFYDAVQEKITGNPDKAIDIYRACLKIDPNAAAVHFELSELFDFQGRFSLAIEHGKKAYELDRTNQWYILNLAQIYQKNGLLNEAIPLLEEVVRLNPDKPEHIFSLAETYRYANQPKKAIEVYNQLEKLVGQNEELTGYKQRIYIEFKMVAEAEKELQALIKSEPENVAYYGMLAELYESTGNSTKALELYEKIIKLEPDNGIVHLSLAYLYRREGQKEKAKQEEIIAFESPYVPIDAKIGILLDYYSRPDYSSVSKHVFELLKNLEFSHPNDPKTFSMYADFYFREDKYEEALEKYKKTTQLDDTKFAIWQQVMLLETQLQLWDSLLVDSRRAINMFPTQPAFYFFNGIANNQLKNYKEAVKMLKAGKDLVIDNNKFLADFHEQLGDAYHNLNEHKLSDENYDKALRIEPNNAFLLNNYSYYLAIRGEKLEKAKEMSKKSISIMPGQSSFLDTYGYILFKLGEYGESESYLKQALEYGGAKDGTVLEHYGDVLFKLNRKEEALEYWKKAKATGVHSEMLDKKLTDKQYYE
jgi:tetratricopeptide (TPR) repeat protein